MITALTSNPKKAQEYADRPWMYGIRTSFRVSPEAPEEEVRALLMTQSPGSIVFRGDGRAGNRALSGRGQTCIFSDSCGPEGPRMSRSPMPESRISM